MLEQLQPKSTAKYSVTVLPAFVFVVLVVAVPVILVGVTPGGVGVTFLFIVLVVAVPVILVGVTPVGVV